MVTVSKLLIALFSLTSASTVFLLTENSKMCRSIDALESHKCISNQDVQDKLGHLEERLFVVDNIQQRMWGRD